MKWRKSVNVTRDSVMQIGVSVMLYKERFWQENEYIRMGQE